MALASYYIKMYEASKSCSAFEAGAFSILRFCWNWGVTKVVHFDVIASTKEMQKVDFNRAEKGVQPNLHALQASETWDSEEDCEKT